VKRDDLDAARGILTGLVFAVILWVLLVLGFAAVISFLKSVIAG